MAKHGVTQVTTIEVSQLFGGDYKSLKNITIKAGEGVAIPRGMVMARHTDGEYCVLDLETAVVGEDLGAATGAIAGVAATEVAAENIAAGDAGGTKVFNEYLAQDDVVPGSVSITATIGGQAKVMNDDLNGKLTHADGHLGWVDYATGFVVLQYATAPDNATNVVAAYHHSAVAAGPGKLTFGKQLAHGKIARGTAKITAIIGGNAVEITDDGFGRFASGAHLGHINYDDGQVEITFGVAPDNATNVVIDYAYGGIGYRANAILASAEAVDATAAVDAAAVLQGPVRLTDLIWPADITAGQKARAIEDLRASGIIAV